MATTMYDSRAGMLLFPFGNLSRTSILYYTLLYADKSSKKVGFLYSYWLTDLYWLHNFRLNI